MITNIKLVNFKCFEDLDLNMRDRRGSTRNCSIIFGNNLTGKTSFLSSYAFLKRSVENLYIMNQMNEKLYCDKMDASYTIVSELASKNNFLDVEKPMFLEWEFALNRNHYKYRLGFTEGTLIEEGLYRKVKNEFVPTFTYDGKTVVWGNRTMVTLCRDSVQDRLVEKNHEFTVLSIIYDYQRQLGADKANLHSSLEGVLSIIDHLVIEIDGVYSSSTVNKVLYGAQRDALEGVIDQSEYDDFQARLIVMNKIVKMLVPSVDKVQYRMTKINDEQYSYVTEVYGVGSEEKFFGPRLSTSLVALLQVMHNLSDFDDEKILIFDDYASHADYFALVDLFTVIMPTMNIKGVFAMKDLDSMNIVTPSSIIMSWVDQERYTLDFLSNITKIQPNHNIRSRYEAGHIVPIRKTEQKQIGTLYKEYRNQKKR